MNHNLLINTEVNTGNPSLFTGPVMRPVSKDDVIRKSLEEFIACTYKNIFSAELTDFLPNLVASTSIDDQIRAAFGYSDAGQDLLFLESYIGEPIENLLSSKLGRKIKRSKIVEVGNLSITNMADSVKSMRDIASYLQSLGYEWIVCTATRYLRLLFLKSGAKPMSIAQALPSKVSNNGTDWGTYYATAPEILIGNVDQSVALIEQKLVSNKHCLNHTAKCINFSRLE